MASPAIMAASVDAPQSALRKGGEALQLFAWMLCQIGNGIGQSWVRQLSAKAPSLVRYRLPGPLAITSVGGDLRDLLLC